MKYVWNQVMLAKGRALLYGCLLIMSPVAFAAEADRNAMFEQARGMLQNGDAAGAYALLLQREVDWSGEDDFDYLFGVAALDSGEPSEAVFSLQRLVARQPKFSGARLELARAYFDLGDNELARTEFEQILTEDPPENVVEAANDYLEAIDARARNYQSDTQFSFDLGFGFDDNAPAATADDVFLNFQLSPNNLEQTSAFAKTAFGLVYNKPLGPETQVLLSARYDHRTNPSTHFVDSTNADFTVGWSFNRGPHAVSISANHVFSWLDRDQNKEDTGLSASYVRTISKVWTVLGFARASQVRFEETALQIQDVDRLSYGFSVLKTGSASVSNLTITGGGDDAQQSASPFSTDTYGLSLSQTWYRPSGRAYFVDAGLSTTEYDDPFFAIDREDDLLTFGVGMTVNKFPARDWVTTAKASYSEKDSTVSLYEFNRLELGITLQRIF